MLFAAVSGAPACCITPEGDNSGMMQIQYILPLTAASIVALNEQRRLLF